MQRRFFVLEPVRFVYRNNSIAQLAEMRLVHHHQLGCREEYMKAHVHTRSLARARGGRELISADQLPGGGIANVGDHVHVGQPPRKLSLPCGHRRQWHDNQKGAIHRLLVLQPPQKADRLQCFSQPHLVSKNHIPPIDP